MLRFPCSFVLLLTLTAACSPSPEKPADPATSTGESAGQSITGAHAPEDVPQKPEPEAGEVHWSYEGAGGPEHWGMLNEAFVTCMAGREQSPINLDTSTAKRADLPDIEVNYRKEPQSLVNNGHTIQVNFPPGSSVQVGTDTYQLLQVHFHTPSEHTINGRSYPMVAHLVHQNPAGALTVVGVLMEEGAPDPLIGELWSAVSEEVGKPVEVAIDPADLLPEDKGYFNYSGSLTTPPCSEGVNWVVLHHPVQVSAEQVAVLADLFGGNARPLQDVNDRTVMLD